MKNKAYIKKNMKIIENISVNNYFIKKFVLKLVVDQN